MTITDTTGARGSAADGASSRSGEASAPPAGGPKGGAWLLEDSAAADVFTPEKLSDEHRLMAQTTDEFVNGEVLPVLDRLEQKDWDLSRALLRRAGELGLLGIPVAEEYGGLDLDKASSLVVVERIARSASFATTFGGQGIAAIVETV